MVVRTVGLSTDSGIYVADAIAVENWLQTSTRRQMIRRMRERWPELFANGTFTYHSLMQEPAYVLAIILSQI